MIKISIYTIRVAVVMLLLMSITMAGCRSGSGRVGDSKAAVGKVSVNNSNRPEDARNKVTVELGHDSYARLVDAKKAELLKQRAVKYQSSSEEQVNILVSDVADVPEKQNAAKTIAPNMESTMLPVAENDKLLHTGKTLQEANPLQQDNPLQAGNPLRTESGTASGLTKQASVNAKDKLLYRITTDQVLPVPAEELSTVIVPVNSVEDIISKLPAFNDPELKNKMISVNFDHADIRSVIKTISDITGINFIEDESINGTVTVLSPTKLQLGELFHFLESILQVKGYTAIPAGDHIKIVPRSKADNFNIRIRIGSDPAKIPQDDSIVTQLMPLRYANAGEISNIIKPGLSAGAQLTVYSRTNTLIITDTSANIYHIACMIKQLDIPGAKKQLSVIPLKYASAQVLSKQITDIMTKGNDMVGRGGIVPNSKISGPDVKIQAEPRTNSLIVIANRDNTDIVEKLVSRLDIERPTGAYNVHVVYLKNAEAKSTAESLSKALTNKPLQGNANNQLPIRVTPDEGTNSLIIQASAQDFKLIDNIIQKLDVERQNVLVELLIMEISEDKLKEIGVDWASMDRAVSNSVRAFGNTNFGVRLDAVNNQPGGLRIGAFKEVGGEVKIGTILSALEKVSGVNILSTPHVLTCNHSPAEIVVGDNIPYVTQSRITETDPSTPTVIKTIDYKDVGVSMKITPHISQGGMVRLAIDSEFTQLIEGVTGLSADTPTTAKRQIKTEISMASGSTIVIGGLIRDSKTKINKKVPLLGDIPLLGGAFRYTKDRREKTNLLLFITPYVLQNQNDLQNITAKKKKEVRVQLPARFRDGD